MSEYERMVEEPILKGVWGMEKPLYRSNLEQVKQAFGDAQLLPLRKVAEFLGISPGTLRSKQDFPKRRIGRNWYITAVALARWMS